MWQSRKRKRLEIGIYPLAAGILAAVLPGLPGASASADDAADSQLSGVELHGFLSQGFIKTTDNNYLGYSKLGTFDFTETGLNLTKSLGDNMQTGLQLYTERIGPVGNFNVGLDWFYFDYHWTDQLGIRFGRVKLPFGLYNDSRDIDSARASVLLPQSIYPEDSQQYLLAENGVELYGYNRLGQSAGALDYRIYGGTIALDASTLPPGTTVNIPYLVGARLMWETPVEGLRAGVSAQAYRLDITYAGASQISGKGSAVPIVASVEYVKQDLLLAVEVNKTFTNTGDSNNPRLIPEETLVSEAGYVMGAYHLTPWLEPALYYSVLFPNIATMSGQENQQHDVSATLRFDINPHWLVKVEGHYMIGTAGLTTTLNGGTPLNQLDNNWATFLVKTTAYF